MTPTPQQNNPTALDLIKQWLDERPYLGKWEARYNESWVQKMLYNSTGHYLVKLNDYGRYIEIRRGMLIYFTPDVDSENGSEFPQQHKIGPISSPDFFDKLEQAIKENMK